MRRDPRPIVVAVLGLALVLAACAEPSDGDQVASLSGDKATGVTGGAAKDAKDKDPQQAALDFARCMREHGVDMPDPEVDDKGRIRVRIGAGGPGGGVPGPTPRSWRRPRRRAAA